MAIKNVGDEFDVTVSIADAENVSGISAWIQFDPAVVEPVDPISAQNLGFIPNATLLADLKSDDNSVLIVGYSAIPPAGHDGAGDCFQVKFRALTAGQTDVVFVTDRRTLSDSNGNVLEANWNDDNVVVNDVVPPTVATVSIEVV